MRQVNISRGLLIILAGALMVLALVLSPAGYSAMASSEDGATQAKETTGASGQAVSDAGHGSEGEGGQGISKKKLWDFIARTMNFVVMVVIIVLLAGKAAKQFFGNRREEIKTTLDDLEQRKTSTEKKYTELEKKISELENERKNIMEEYAREGEKEKNKIIDHAHEMSERIQQQAQVAIQREIKQAKDQLRSEIAELSAAMAEELVKDNINESDQTRLVEEYLEKVVSN